MNILDLLSSDGITAKKASGTNGGEYSSRCPMCGGMDRFRSWPEQNKWWCRQCGGGGDLIQYLRDVRGLSFREACLSLGCEPSPVSLPWNKPAKDEWTPREPKQHAGELWQEKALALVVWAENQLWSEAGKDLLEWLKIDRGFTEETIRAFRLGCIPRDAWRDRKAWGLPEQLNDKEKPKRLWLPAGLLIPFFHGEGLIKIKIRRSDPEADPRYYLLPGSSTKAMALPGEKKALMVLESELDALLVQQEAGDLCGALALGSASARPDCHIIDSLSACSLILVSLDSDEAGAKEAWQWWAKHFPQAKRWPPVNGKDPGEMHKAGVDVQLWVKAGIPETKEENEQSAEFKPVPKVCRIDRETTKAELTKMYQIIGETYGKADWERLVSIHRWKAGLDELERTFTVAWNEGCDCWKEFEALRDHWRAGLRAIREEKAA